MKICPDMSMFFSLYHSNLGQSRYVKEPCEEETLSNIKRILCELM